MEGEREEKKNKKAGDNFGGGKREKKQGALKEKGEGEKDLPPCFGKRIRVILRGKKEVRKIQKKGDSMGLREKGNQLSCRRGKGRKGPTRAS